MGITVETTINEWNTPKDRQRDNFPMKGSANRTNSMKTQGLYRNAFKELSIKHLIQYFFVFLFHYFDTRMKAFIRRVFSDIVIRPQIIVKI